MAVVNKDMEEVLTTVDMEDTRHLPQEVECITAVELQLAGMVIIIIIAVDIMVTITIIISNRLDIIAMGITTMSRDAIPVKDMVMVDTGVVVLVCGTQSSCK